MLLAIYWSFLLKRQAIQEKIMCSKMPDIIQNAYKHIYIYIFNGFTIIHTWRIPISIEFQQPRISRGNCKRHVARKKTSCGPPCIENAHVNRVFPRNLLYYHILYVHTSVFFLPTPL